jgi:ABC-2 type transport system ATP-binding protein
VAQGTPEELKSGLNGDSVQVDLAEGESLGRAAGLLEAVTGVREVTAAAGTVRARVADGPAVLPAVLAALAAGGVPLRAVSVARPTLDDVYLRYAGRTFDTGADSLNASTEKQVA